MTGESSAHSEAGIRESLGSASLGNETGPKNISASQWGLKLQGMMIPGTCMPVWRDQDCLWVLWLRPLDLC